MRSAEAKRTDSMRTASRDASLRVVGGGKPTRRQRRKARPRRYCLPVEETTRRFDPIDHPTGISRRLRIAIYFLAAALLHAGVFFGLVRFEGGDRSALPSRPRPEKVTVRMTEPIRRQPKPVSIPEPRPVPEPETTTAPALEPPPPTAPKQKVIRRPRKQQPAAAPDVPVDPVNISEKAPSATEAPRRRVVGINFESTVTGGDGPAFAVGNTRMGTTGKVAEAAKDVAPIAGRTYRPGPKQPTGNRVSTVIPTAGVTLTKPKRLASEEPQYPKLLKAQGIEGNVAVLIQISETGTVTSVKVVKGSGYPEFDKAAKAAALKARFSPAKRNGAPISYTLKYTYRFRVKE
jgi:TonB family protein